MQQRAKNHKSDESFNPFNEFFENIQSWWFKKHEKEYQLFVQLLMENGNRMKMILFQFIWLIYNLWALFNAGITVIYKIVSLQNRRPKDWKKLMTNVNEVDKKISYCIISRLQYYYRVLLYSFSCFCFVCLCMFM